MTDQERENLQENYDLLGEVIHAFKVDQKKYEINLWLLNKMSQMQTLSGKVIAPNQQMAVDMVKGQVDGIPQMIDVAKELRFEIYEKLHGPDTEKR